MTESIYDPTTAQIADALLHGGRTVEFWNSCVSEWQSLDYHFTRLVPVAPKTERVPLHRVIGRRLPGTLHKVVKLEVRANPAGDVWWHYLQPDEDGCVEVLAEDPS